MKTLFLCPPSYDGFDGGAGSRYQARREVTSFWYPTWLAQPAALVPGSRLLDCPPQRIGLDECLRIAREFDLVVIHTSTPSLRSDLRVAEAIKTQRSGTTVGMVGAHVAVQPAETLKASAAVDWVARKEFDRTCAEVAEGQSWDGIAGLSYRREGRVVHNPDRAPMVDLDSLPWVVDVYHRDLRVEDYAIGYLMHPYLSLYTGRGCPAQCTFCLWPQTIGGHQYRVRSAANVVAELDHARRLFPQVKEYFFDDDTFTANLPRAREIARGMGRLGLTWSCNSRANLDERTIRELRENGLRLFLVGYESGNAGILQRAKKGVTLDEMRRFTEACHRAGVVIHGTFMLGLPGETPETIAESIRFAQELDVFSIQVSLAAPYPGTELYELARQNGWFAAEDPRQGLQADGFQQSVLEYPGLSREAIYESVERFYREYFLRPKPVLRILRTMLEDKEVCVRRLREGYEFFRSMAQRRAQPGAG